MLRDLTERLRRAFPSGESGWIEVVPGPGDKVNVTMVSAAFNQGLAARREAIAAFLAERNLRAGFITALTPDEARRVGVSPVEPSTQAQHSPASTWFDAAMAAGAARSVRAANGTSTAGARGPIRTVAFYSFKGGVGRTTAVAYVAWLLAQRGRKVLTVDMDLESPGLPAVFGSRVELPDSGLVDYLAERLFGHGAPPSLHAADILAEVSTDGLAGRILVIQAGRVSRGYVAKVDDLTRAQQRGVVSTSWRALMDEVKQLWAPDVVLLDARTGINVWGAFSALEVADEVIALVFPNSQNMQGMRAVMESLSASGERRVRPVASLVPATAAGRELAVRELGSLLAAEGQEELADADDAADVGTEESPDAPLVFYSADVALATEYPVPTALMAYAPVANLVDEDAAERSREQALRVGERWEVVEDLRFQPVDAAKSAELESVFQRTPYFDRFLDGTTCLIRGRKGTGKSALYWVALRHRAFMEKNSAGRVTPGIKCVSAHGPFSAGPGSAGFGLIHERLAGDPARWEGIWASYALVRLTRAFPARAQFLQGKQLAKVRLWLKSFARSSGDTWVTAETEALARAATDAELRSLMFDALKACDERLDRSAEGAWLLYDNLDEDLPEYSPFQRDALHGLFKMVQSLDERNVRRVVCKIFLREDLWERLNFPNKSHFRGRDVYLEWKRPDFLRLALRQALQSPTFESLCQRLAPVPDPDGASDVSLIAALDLLWGARRERGRRSKFVRNWVFERLTDGSGTTFPRSLSVLLDSARQRELAFREEHVDNPTDRLLRRQSLTEGYQEAAEQRAAELRQEYKRLDDARLFDELAHTPYLAKEEELQTLLERTVKDLFSFPEFVLELEHIGLIDKKRERDGAHRFAFLYAAGFHMRGYAGYKAK